MIDITTSRNTDLVVVEGNKSRWSHADYRRFGWHNLHRIARYGSSYRAADVMRLEKGMDLRIAELESVRHMTSLPCFSAMIVIQGQRILFERYAADFGPRSPHSIQSITKTTLNLIVGKLLEAGVLDLSRTVGHYIPEIGTGYARATLQQVLNMDVVNEYSEDFTNPEAAYYQHEEAMGWRLPRNSEREATEHAFLPQITSVDTDNHSGHTHYKDANTAVLGWVAERASGRPLRAYLADIVDAAGLEDALYITTDREGVPTLEGGACLTARDLARYFSLFVRRGRGVKGQTVGSAEFIERTHSAGVPMPHPYEGIRYSNHLMVSGPCYGHGGWGGQYVMANLDTQTIGVYFSVVENPHGNNQGNFVHTLIAMLETVVSTKFT